MGSFGKTLASPNLELPRRLAPFVAPQWQLHAQPGDVISISRYDKDGQPQPVLSIQAGINWEAEQGYRIIRLASILPRPAMEHPQAFRQEEPTAEIFGNRRGPGVLRAVLLGPSLADNSLYTTPGQLVDEGYLSQYGRIAPLPGRPQSAPILDICMPNNPYGGIGIIDVSVER